MTERSVPPHLSSASEKESKLPSPFKKNPSLPIAYQVNYINRLSRLCCCFLMTATASGIADPLDHWTRVDLGPGGRPWKVAYGNGRYVAVGDGFIAYSDDGRVWTRLQNPFGWLSDVRFGNGIFLAREFTTSSRNCMLVSRDGISWSRYECETPLSSIAFANGRFLAVSDGSVATAYSVDGQIWNYTWLYGP